jgi:hypothetical protein
MKKLIFVVCLFASSSAFATTGFWTGNKEPLDPDNAKTSWKCEYRVAYTTRMILVWRIFPDSCPAEIEFEVDGD